MNGMIRQLGSQRTAPISACHITTKAFFRHHIAAPADPVTRLNTALEGRYAIERELGEGGMATLCLADDQKSERDPRHTYSLSLSHLG